MSTRNFSATSRPRARNRKSELAAALGPYRVVADALQARVAQGRHPFVRDVTLSNSTFGNRYVQLAAPHLGVHALGGGIGQGVAMAVGAALAASPAKTVALIGDGGAMVNLGELATVAETKADIVFVLMNDRGYGVIRNIQDAQYGGRRHYADLHTPDFAWTRASALPTHADAGLLPPDAGRPAVFGKGASGVAWAAASCRFDGNRAWAAETEARMRRYFPSLDDVPVTHHWAGPIDRSRTGLPLLGRLGGHAHILYGVGWSGKWGRPERSLADACWPTSPSAATTSGAAAALVDQPTNGLPPEPVRYLGARLVRAAVARKEQAEDAGLAPRPLDVRLAGLAPSSIKDASH